MKEIYLIRHAKSSWSSSHRTDFDRPLNERGVREGPQVASVLAKEWNPPDILLSSPAIRAYQTAQFFRSSWGLSWKQFSLTPSLYEASLETLQFILNETLERHDTVAIVAHNPGLSVLASELCNAACELKTACAAKIAVNGPIGPGEGDLLALVQPRK